MTKSALFDKALTLPTRDRARLARKLISSLDGPSDPEAAAAWALEIERRAKEVKDGSVKLIDWVVIRKRLRIAPS